MKANRQEVRIVFGFDFVAARVYILFYTKMQTNARKCKRQLLAIANSQILVSAIQSSKYSRILINHVMIGVSHVSLLMFTLDLNIISFDLHRIIVRAYFTGTRPLRVESINPLL